MTDAAKSPMPLDEGETLLVELEFVQGGVLGWMLAILGPLLATEVATGGVVTDRRIGKTTKSGKRYWLELSKVTKVFHNSNSDSLAVTAEPADQGLILARVANCAEVVEVLQQRGLEVEEEWSSPRRRSLR